MENDCWNFKFIVLGDTGVGKTCIILRLRDGTFQMVHDATIGVTFSVQLMHIGSTDLKLQVWDTAGQEIFRSITRSYYRDSNVALIVYDVSNIESFKCLQSWISDVREFAPPTCKIALVGNKIDLESKRRISESEGQKFADDHKIDYFKETSALTGENVREMFEELAWLVYSQIMNDPKSSSIQRIPQTIDEMPEKGRGKGGCC